MSTAKLQVRLDQLMATSRQRWMLAVLVVASITLSSLAIARATPFADTWVVYCVAAIAIVVAADPSEQLGLFLMSVVLFQWLTSGQPVTSPWAMAFALTLHLFHTVVALIAVTPHTAAVDRAVLWRWSIRSVVIACLTVGVWFAVVGFERRELPGNVALSVMAFAVLAAAVVSLAVRTLSTPEHVRR